MPADRFPPPYTGSTVYHYTDAAGLIGMVQNHVLWATESSGLNDPREGRYVQDILTAHQAPAEKREEFESYRESVELLSDDVVYVTSASTHPDDVSQWVRYTSWPEVGYCVGLDARVPLHIARTHPPRRLTVETFFSIFDAAHSSAWSQVVYGQQDFDRAMANFYPWVDDNFAAMLREHDEDEQDTASQQAYSEAVGTLASATRLYKDAGFAAESEVRIVAGTRSSGEFIKYRPSRFGVVRYVELAAGPPDQGFVIRDSESGQPDDLLPIVSVTIGPSPFAERGLASVRQLLKDCGHRVEPTISQVQVR